MEPLNHQPLPEDIIDAAASWSARERGGTLSAAEKRQLASWRADNPLHEQAWCEMNHVWSTGAAVPDAYFQNILQRHASPSRTPLSSVPASSFFQRRRALGVGLGMACAAGLAYVAVDRSLWAPEVQFQSMYSSKRGERSNVTLPDGSTLALNTDSSVEVRFYAHQRIVTLHAGEVYFAVASNKARPFIVNAGQTQVKVTGTQFNVRRHDDDVIVSVASGSVEVSSGPWWDRSIDALTSEQAVEVDSTLRHHRIDTPNVKIVTAWRNGKLIFDNVSLAQVVAELNRYRDQPILIRNPAIQTLRIAGVFNLDRPHEFLRVLPTMVPVQIIDFADGRQEIAPRKK